jgi:hypothetical protein
MPKELNIFSEPQEVPGKKPKGYINIYKKNYNYRKSDNKEICCNTCECIIKVLCTRFYKCKNIGVTSSQSTDIHLRDVCNLHKLNK